MTRSSSSSRRSKRKKEEEAYLQTFDNCRLIDVVGIRRCELRRIIEDLVIANRFFIQTKVEHLPRSSRRKSLKKQLLGDLKLIPTGRIVACCKLELCNNYHYYYCCTPRYLQSLARHCLMVTISSSTSTSTSNETVSNSLKKTVVMMTRKRETRTQHNEPK